MNPVEIVVPIYGLGVETEVIFPALVLHTVCHRRPQPLHVGVIEASLWSEQIQRMVSGRPKMQKE